MLIDFSCVCHFGFWKIHVLDSCHSSGAVAQMVERSLSMREAAGSMPASSTFCSVPIIVRTICFRNDFRFGCHGASAALAQLVRA